MRILTIGDPHATPGYDNHRFTWLGRYICSVRPDVVYCTGDFGDWASLCKHSRASEKEGRRIREDRHAVIDALAKLHDPITAYNSQRRASKKGPYKPRFVITLGNHDVRPGEYETDHPEFKDAQYAEYTLAPFKDRGWEIVGYKEFIDLGGFVCSHHFPSGIMGKPIGGANIASALLSRGHQSCIVGHDHRFRMATLPRFDGTRIHGISAGCYVHAGYRESWCKNTEPMWDRGVLLLDGVEAGDFTSYTWTTQEELKRRFG